MNKAAMLKQVGDYFTHCVIILVLIGLAAALLNIGTNKAYPAPRPKNRKK